MRRSKAGALVLGVIALSFYVFLRSNGWEGVAGPPDASTSSPGRVAAGEPAAVPQRQEAVGVTPPAGRSGTLHLTAGNGCPGEVEVFLLGAAGSRVHRRVHLPARLHLAVGGWAVFVRGAGALPSFGRVQVTDEDEDPNGTVFRIAPAGSVRLAVDVAPERSELEVHARVRLDVQESLAWWQSFDGIPADRRLARALGGRATTPSALPGQADPDAVFAWMASLARGLEPPTSPRTWGEVVWTEVVPPDGRVLFPSLPAGPNLTWRLLADAACSVEPSTRDPAEVSLRSLDERLESLPFTLRCGEETALRGRVLPPTGVRGRLDLSWVDPAALDGRIGVSQIVEVERGGRPMTDLLAEALLRPDSEGRFYGDLLAPGPKSLSAAWWDDAGNVVVAQRRFMAVEGEISDLGVVAPTPSRPLVVEVRLVDPEGRSLEPAEVFDEEDARPPTMAVAFHALDRSPDEELRVLARLPVGRTSVVHGLGAGRMRASCTWFGGQPRLRNGWSLLPEPRAVVLDLDRTDRWVVEVAVGRTDAGRIVLQFPRDAGSLPRGEFEAEVRWSGVLEGAPSSNEEGLSFRMEAADRAVATTPLRLDKDFVVVVLGGRGAASRWVGGAPLFWDQDPAAIVALAPAVDVVIRSERGDVLPATFGVELVGWPSSEQAPFRAHRVEEGVWSLRSVPVGATLVLRPTGETWTVPEGGGEWSLEAVR